MKISDVIEASSRDIITITRTGLYENAWRCWENNIHPAP